MTGRWRVTLPLALGLLAQACGGAERKALSDFEVPRPDLSRADAEVRRQLTLASEGLEALLADGAASSEERAAAVGEVGRLFHAYDLVTDAESCYREALRLAPADGGWDYYLGFSLQVRGELDEAAERFEAVLDLEPEDLAALLRLAEVRFLAGEAAAAEGLFRRALTAVGGAAAAHRGLGSIAADAGRAAAAIEHFEAALQLQPAATSLHYPLARAYRRLGDQAAADRHLERSGSAPVSFPDPRVAALDELAVGAGVRLARGGVALSQGRPGQALAEYRQAVAADPDNPAVRLNLGLLLAAAGDLEGAEREIVEALRLEPGSLQARIALADLLAARGNLSLAMAEYSTLLEREPANLAARRGRAAVLIEAGDVEAAARDLRRVVDDQPESVTDRLALGSALQQLGEPEEAAVHYRQALALDDDPSRLAATNLSLGNLLAARGELERAVQLYRQAVELKPELREAHHNLAGALAGLGRHAEAAASYTDLVELAPDDLEARFFLGESLLRVGRLPEAREAFVDVVAAEPAHEGARLGEATALAGLGRPREARAALESGLAVLPRSGALAHELARLLAAADERALRDGGRALELAAALFEGRPTALHAETLAMALAETGRFGEAAELQRQLVDQVTADGDPATGARLRRTLELYESGEPCCPPPN